MVLLVAPTLSRSIWTSSSGCQRYQRHPYAIRHIPLAVQAKSDTAPPLAPHAPPRRPSRTDVVRLEKQPRALRALVHLAVGEIGHLAPHSEMRTCLQQSQLSSPGPDLFVQDERSGARAGALSSYLSSMVPAAPSPLRLG